MSAAQSCGNALISPPWFAQVPRILGSVPLEVACQPQLTPRRSIPSPPAHLLTLLMLAHPSLIQLTDAKAIPCPLSPWLCPGDPRLSRVSSFPAPQPPFPGKPYSSVLGALLFFQPPSRGLIPLCAAEWDTIFPNTSLPELSSPGGGSPPGLVLRPSFGAPRNETSGSLSSLHSLPPYIRRLTSLD